MSNYLNIFYSTSNIKKIEFIRMMMRDHESINIHGIDSQSFCIKETNDPKLNAQLKSVEISKLFKGLILSSDDCLTFLDEELSIHSGALIYRNISSTRNSKRITQYYIDLINTNESKSIKTKLTSHFCFSKAGIVLTTFEYSYYMILQVPEKIITNEDMPLSQLHFVAEKKKFYNQLSLREQLNFHKSFRRIFKYEVSKLKNSELST